MNTLASFLASNYALYSSGQIRPGMYYNPFPYHPHNTTYLPSSSMPQIPQLTSSGQPESTKSPETPNDSNVSTNCTNDKVKFSIDSILARKSKTDENVTEEVKADDMWLPEDDGSINPDEDQTDAQKFSWLQCTRYKPPKLPRLKKKDGVKKRKLGRNPRVPFTQHQVAVLEQKFRRTHYLSSMDVVELSTALNLTETRVRSHVIIM
ncbi:hypothetical protein FSP39_015264 [Pinctada imbricata]|uniref:Homeobox domain-containing protein n=1 Tax=Pinctada imbricata TaxID=66713 RepID=A0AA88Y3L8_PINIB|nr:hypothetical protein FSP39_015264 [Pinctada imbricata]